jgi:hypothetical protein
MEQGTQQVVRPIKQLADELIKYIDHSNILSQRSRNYDNNVSFRNSLHKCNRLKLWLNSFKGYYPTHEFCRTVVENSGHLHNILPNPSNKSYRSSMDSINSILEQVKIKLKNSF